jgi:hypothetical protein
MKYKALLLITVAILVVGLDGYCADRWRTFVIKGRVVSDDGQPLPGAQIIIMPSERPRQNVNQSYDEVFEVWQAESDGSFSIRGTAPSLPEKWTLYVTSAMPPDTDSLVSPPFRLQKDILDRLFAFPRVVVKGEEVNVGDVGIRLHHISVYVKLLMPDGSPAFSEADAWPPVRLRVWDARGRAVDEIRLSERAFRKSESTFAVSLPNGEWKLEVEYEGHKAQAKFDVPDRSGRLDMVMKLQ